MDAQTSQFLFDANGNLLVQSANINDPPQIIGQPLNRAAGPGETAAFSVVAKGALPLTFQWRFNGTDIGGATGDALLLQNVSTNNEGEFRVVVTNPSGSVTSAPAFLMIDTDGDNMGDAWELTYFSDLDQNATRDFDGDGSSNFEEFRNGTDPTDRNSFAFDLLVISDGGTVIKSPDQRAYTNGQTVTLTAVPPTNGTFHAWLGAVVTRTNPLTLVMNSDKTVYARFTPIIFNWTSLASGDWDVAVNWTPRLVPGSNDTIVINKSVTVALNTSADCADVTLGNAASNPILTGTGTLTIRGNFAWASGTMSGSGRTIVETGGTLTLGNPSALLLIGRTLENGGVASRTEPGIISMNSGAVITNRAGALFHVQHAASFASFTGINRIDNAGRFVKSVNAGTTTIPNGLSFNNYGSVEIEIGTFELAGGGVHTANSSMTGAGHLMISGNTTDFAGLVNVTGNNTIIGGAANFTGNTICSNNTLTISGGTANFSGTGLLSPAVLNLSNNGTLTGTSTVTVNSVINWTGGAMSGSGRTIISAGVTLHLPGSAGATLNTRTLENGGTVLWTGTGLIGMNSGAVITNRPGALFHVQNAAPVSFAFGGNRIDNAGTFRKSVNVGTTTVGSGVSFNNFGTVELQTGTLNLGGGGTHSGSFDVPAGTALILSGGSHTANGSSSIAGAGQFTVSGGAATLAGLVNVSGNNTFSGGTANFTGNTICTNNTVTISGIGTANFSGTGLVSPAVLDLINGTLTGTSTVTVNTVMNWTGGTMSGTGRTIIPAGATLNAAILSVVTMTSRTLENGGTVLWTGAGNVGLFGSAVITNRAGALFHAQTATSLGFFSGADRFDNAGTFRKSANNGTLSIGSSGSFNNFGTVEVQAGTLLCSGGFNNSGAVNLLAGTTNRLAGGGSVSGSFTAPAGALVEWTGGGFTLNPGAQLNGAGLYRINGGNVTADANLTVENLDLVHGSSMLRGTGTVTIANVMNWALGTMDGSGRITISAGATLQVGSASGVNLQRTLENGGTAIWTGAGTFILLNGVITNRAGALFHAQNAAVIFPIGNCRFDNAGTFRKSASTGTTTVQSGMSFNNSGTVDIRSGILAANSSYTSTSNALLSCALGGTTPGTGFGQLQVAGTVTLNGALGVELINGFIPATNSSFTVLTAGTRNGTFASFFYPSNAATMQLSNTANSVIVRVTDVFSVPQPAPVPAGLISWWRAEGNALDTFGTNHGAASNGVVYVAGKVGQGFAFDGINDFVWIPDATNLRPTSITLEAWAKFNGPQGPVLGRSWGPGIHNSYVIWQLSGNLNGTIGDTNQAADILSTPFAPVSGQWYHVAFTFDDVTKRQVLYLNGVEVASGQSLRAIGYDNHPVVIGGDIDNGSVSFLLNGGVDEAAIYNRALTTDEIAAIYNAGVAGKQVVTTLAQPMLFPPVLSSSNVLLSWTAVSNQTYRLEFNLDPGLTNWGAVSGDVTTLSNRAAKPDALTSSNRFYRVRVLP